MSGMIISLRKQLKAANAEITRLKGQNAQEILDLAAQHPVAIECLIRKSLIALLRKLGETVSPHDTLHHKMTNIVTAKNNFRELNRELMKTPASEMLKQAIAVIQVTTDGMTLAEYEQAAKFLEHPIVKAMTKEMLAD